MKIGRKNPRKRKWHVWIFLKRRKILLPLQRQEACWLTFNLNDADWAVCYRQRPDYKLGLKFKYIRRHDSNEGSTPEKPVSMEVKIMQETFDPDNHCFKSGPKWDYNMPGTLC